MERSTDIIISLLVIIIGLPFIFAVLVIDFIIITGTSIGSGNRHHFKNSPLFLQSRAVSLNKKEIKIYKIKTIIDSVQVKQKPVVSSQILNHEEHRRRETINALPGITGYWQIAGDREKGINNLIELDEYYEKNKSFLLDTKIIISTITVMITAAHSDAVIRKQKAYSGKPKWIISKV